MEHFFFMPSITHDFYHFVRDKNDIRGICGALGDNSVDAVVENEIGRTGTTDDLPEGQTICDACQQTLEDEANGRTGEDQAADSEGTAGTDGQGDLGTGESVSQPDADVSEEPSTGSDEGEGSVHKARK